VFEFDKVVDIYHVLVTGFVVGVTIRYRYFTITSWELSLT
jgi:hypothetical protein